MFRIKICGITNVEDAVAAAEAGADAIGLNFYANSPRCISIGLAQEIAAAVPGGVARVGVFVNAPAEEMLDVRHRVGLDFLQLHGDEPPDVLAALQAEGAPLIRAFRCGEEGLAPLLDHLEHCRTLECLPQVVLIDAKAPGAYGGTGEVVSWDLLTMYEGRIFDCPILLAGGLTPENVADAIRIARPWGVDTASGVEISPGKKEGAKVRAFVAAARAELEHNPGTTNG